MWFYTVSNSYWQPIFFLIELVEMISQPNSSPVGSTGGNGEDVPGPTHSTLKLANSVLCLGRVCFGLLGSDLFFHRRSMSSHVSLNLLFVFLSSLGVIFYTVLPSERTKNSVYMIFF